ncbi:MAG: hypothetical protein LBP75_02850 [Planctomycetota bacterium]|nr:hypothetical protein [Planctomycetota bacterium]
MALAISALVTAVISTFGLAATSAARALEKSAPSKAAAACGVKKLNENNAAARTARTRILQLGCL